MEVTSEMFLSILILLQNSLPCTENFYRYQKNFEKYISQDGADASKARPGLNGEVRTIASPRMIGSSSPVASLAKMNGISFNPPSQKNMLSFVAKLSSNGADARDDTVTITLRSAK